MNRRGLAIALLVTSVLWVLGLMLAPWAAADLPESETGLRAYGVAAVYLVGSVVCHQRADRSFHLGAVQLPVCARCCGLYAAAPAGIALALLPAGWRLGARPSRRRTGGLRTLLLITATPTAALVLVEWAGLAHPSPVLRAAGAVPLGLATGWMMAAALCGELR